MSQNTKPILLVEDNPMDADLTLRLFSKHGCVYPIEVARDGEEAIDFIRRWDAGEMLPEVILLDLNLPKVNGVDVLRAYRAHEITRQIPVILLFSSEEDRAMHDLGRLGEVPYLVKPINFEKFQQLALNVGFGEVLVR